MRCACILENGVNVENRYKGIRPLKYVKTSTRDHRIATASKLFAKSFENDPLLAYLFPNSSLALREAIFRYRLSQGVQNGVLYDEHEKGFLLLSRGTKARLSREALPLIPYLVWNLPRVVRFLRLHRETQRFAPKNCLVLGPLAVDPAHQGEGIAGRIVRRALVEVRHQGQPCFCRTYVRGNVRVFARFGFRLVDEREVDGLRCWTFVSGTA